MALSSDEIIKREIFDKLSQIKPLQLRIFTQGSNDDQKLFSDGGLTFSYNNVDYGSCDAAWTVRYHNDASFFNVTEIDTKKGVVYGSINPVESIPVDDTELPFVALEGTDALNRKSSGNAQYQRFHHALGAVKNGIIGVYYLKKGIDKIQPDLYGMAIQATLHEKGIYLIIDDLDDLLPILQNYNNPNELKKAIKNVLTVMNNIYLQAFQSRYNSDWETFAKKRSTIIYKDKVVKYAGRMRRNFTDGSQRAGHIAVGEMYLTKYFFYGKKIQYLMLKMTDEDVRYLDKHKSMDKEWYLLRHEPDVEIKTMDSIIGLDKSIKQNLLLIQDEPLNGGWASKVFNECKKDIDRGLRNGTLSIL